MRWVTFVYEFHRKGAKSAKISSVYSLRPLRLRGKKNWRGGQISVTHLFDHYIIMHKKTAELQGKNPDITADEFYTEVENLVLQELVWEWFLRGSVSHHTEPIFIRWLLRSSQRRLR